MPRPKGLPKTGGRIRGTPNKRTDELARKLSRIGCDPMEGMARIAMDPEIAPELRVRCFIELAQYLYPKRKPVDLVLPEDSATKIRVEFVESPPDIGLGDLPIPAEFREPVTHSGNLPMSKSTR